MLVAADSKDSLAVGVPVRKSFLQQRFIPCEEKLGKLVIVDGICIWGICYPIVEQCLAINRYVASDIETLH
jgi:hypothetical protein